MVRRRDQQGQVTFRGRGQHLQWGGHRVQPHDRSFSACSAGSCVAAAIEGAGATAFYKVTLALEKAAPYPTAISKDLKGYIGSLIKVQKDINAVAKAKTIAAQKTLVSSTLELDVDDLSFRGIHIPINLAEQKKF